MNKGLIHLYCGDGKGKTSAASGMALRCAGAGGRVVFAVFLKDGTSSEMEMLKRCPEIEILCCAENFGFTSQMDGRTREMARAAYSELFSKAAALGAKADMVILDEICAACRHGFVGEDRLLAFLDDPERTAEVILTGRDPSGEMTSRADYITCMEKKKHPFDRGIGARKGIEY